VKGDISVFFKGNDSLLYIGNGCNLSKVQIRSRQKNDFIAIGNQVTTTSTNVWISGNGAGKANPAIIIGDDCMFSYDVVIRNSDVITKDIPRFSIASGVPAVAKFKPDIYWARRDSEQAKSEAKSFIKKYSNSSNWPT